MARRNLKINYYGFLGFLGFMGFGDPWYFLFFLFFLFFFASQKPAGEGGLIEKQAEEKIEHKKKVLEMLDGKDKITNDDVQRLLGVSDATAERYLNELEKEGVLRQKGEKKGVFYEKTG